MFHVKSVEEVFCLIEEEFSDIRLKDREIPLTEAAGRILSADLSAAEDVPGFHRSSVDGYAVIAQDTFGASETMPAQLQLVEEVQMGVKPRTGIERGQATYVPTGGEIPPNANAVVMIEYTENYQDGFVYIDKPAAPGNHVVFQGDDVKKSQRVLQNGKRLRAQDIGVLAALGIEKVPVKEKIKVGIISTGDEVIEINQEISGAKVRDVNAYTLYAGLLEYGAQPISYGIVRDNAAEIREVLQEALQECDVVLISGGSSVGIKDETYHVIDSLGKPGILVHGIAIKPGKPTILGKIGNKAVFGLPGHPASAFFIFKVFVLRLLDRISGISAASVNKTLARLACNFPSNNGREEYIPVTLEEAEGIPVANPIFGKSGLITLLSKADGYVRLSRGAEGAAAGETVEVIFF